MSVLRSQRFTTAVSALTGYLVFSNLLSQWAHARAVAAFVLTALVAAYSFSGKPIPILILAAVGGAASQHIPMPEWVGMFLAAAVGWLYKSHIVLVPCAGLLAGMGCHWLLPVWWLGWLSFFSVSMLAYMKLAPKALRSSRASGFYNPGDPKTPIKTSIKDPASVTLSVVIPAYNEEFRLPPMLQESLTYLSKRASSDRTFKFEILVVDDGSKDRTFEEAIHFTKMHGIEQVRVLKLIRNCGKGAAVREGMLRARGEFILFADADGAAPVSQWTSLADAVRLVCGGILVSSVVSASVLRDGRCEMQGKVKDDMGVAIGVRAKQQRTGLRNLLSWGWHFLVQSLCSVGIRDTQCGYKLFTREAARRIFPYQHLDRWCFDVEVLFLARLWDIEICPVLVQWNEVEGSKVSWHSMLHMLLELVQLRLCYRLGLWGIPGL